MQDRILVISKPAEDDLEMEKPTILYVEDDAEQAFHVAKVIESKGCTVIYSSNPLEALEKLDSGKIEIVLCDCVFEGHTPRDTKKFLQASVDKNILTVMYTADNWVKLPDIGGLHLFIKPLDPKNLCDELCELYEFSKEIDEKMEVSLEDIVIPNSHFKTPIEKETGKVSSSSSREVKERVSKGAELLSINRRIVDTAKGAFGEPSKRELNEMMDDYRRITKNTKPHGHSVPTKAKRK